MNKAVTVLHCDRFCIIAVSHPRSAPTLPKPHYPSPHTKLASLVKGRWIDGKAQTVALLRFICDISAFFMLQTFLTSRRRDCHTTTRPAPTLPKPHYPLLCTITLASLVTGEVLSPEKIRATTGGIALHPHHQLDLPHYHPRFS